jgi:hypothetical protein
VNNIKYLKRKDLAVPLFHDNFLSVDVILGFFKKSFPLKSPDAMISSTTNKWGRAGEVLGK